MRKKDYYLELIILTLACMFLYAFVSRAQDETHINLARCLMAETSGYSGSNDHQWAAMSWVLRKRSFQMSQRYRRPIDLNETTLNYCAVFDPRSPHYYGQRAIDIRRSTFDDPQFGKPETWEQLEVFVDRFLKGVVGDPCPVALHFGAKTDVSGKPFYVEVCKRLGKRGNKFYRINHGR